MPKHRALAAPDATIKMARRLRQEMSLPEILLWRQLRTSPGGYLFRKQHPLGRYALDFCCVRARLAIEVDGAHHAMGDRPDRDANRDARVAQAGFQTIRIAASDVLRNMEGVIIAIVATCQARARPTPPRNGEVAARKADGGAGRHVDVISDGERPLHHPADGPPPRSGEDLR